VNRLGSILWMGVLILVLAIILTATTPLGFFISVLVMITAGLVVWVVAEILYEVNK
jgi:hypothetical protein